MPQYVAFTDIYPDGPVGSAAAGGSGGQPGNGLNDDYPGLPAGAVPKHVDKLITTAATTVLWAPQAGKLFVVTHIFMTSDVDQTVTVFDQNNIEGSRLLRMPVAAQAGADPVEWPGVYVSKVAGNTLQVTNTAAGNLFIAVDGYERSA